MHIDQRALELFRSQGGIASRDQVLALDYSARQIQHRVTTGQWDLVRRNVYFHPAFPESERMKLFALTVNDSGHIGHRFGARKYSLDPLLRALPEVTTRPGLGLRFPGIIVHESKQLHLADVRFIDGLPVSGPARTILDCCAVVPEQWKILGLIDSARSKKLVTADELRACLIKHARRGRDGTVRFREALGVMAERDRIAIGPIGRKAAEVLTAGGLPRPTHEVKIFDERGNFVAQTDSFWPNGYVHMYDGFTYHRSRRGQTKRDMEQRAALRSLGLIVDEFSAEHVFDDPAYLLRTSRDGYSQAQRNHQSIARWTVG